MKPSGDLGYESHPLPCPCADNTLQPAKARHGRNRSLRLVSLRLFGCPPGAYGAGVAELVESKQWKERAELGSAYIFHSAHVYGRNAYGKKRKTIKTLCAWDGRTSVTPEDVRKAANIALPHRAWSLPMQELSNNTEQYRK